MPQSLIQMPKDADIMIHGEPIKIRDHKVVSFWSLFVQIIRIAQNWNSNRNTLVEFEKHGISFEIAIEYCAKELEHNAGTLQGVLDMDYTNKDVMSRFSRSEEGRKMADMYIEKIRSCDDWGELYDQMQLTSEFTKDMKSRINMDC